MIDIPYLFCPKVLLVYEVSISPALYNLFEKIVDQNIFLLLVGTKYLPGCPLLATTEPNGQLVPMQRNSQT